MEPIEAKSRCPVAGCRICEDFARQGASRVSPANHILNRVKEMFWS